MSKPRFWKNGALLVVAGFFISGCVMANPLVEVFESSAIANRKAVMRSVGSNWKKVKKAVKAGNYKAAGKAAGKLYKAAGKIKKAFKKNAKDGITRARPNIWKNMGDFNQKAEFLAVAAAVFSQVHAKSGNKARVAKATH